MIKHKQIRDNLEENLHYKLRGQLGYQLEGRLSNELEDRLWHGLYNEVKFELWLQLGTYEQEEE